MVRQDYGNDLEDDGLFECANLELPADETHFEIDRDLAEGKEGEPTEQTQRGIEEIPDISEADVSHQSNVEEQQPSTDFTKLSDVSEAKIIAAEVLSGVYDSFKKITPSDIQFYLEAGVKEELVNVKQQKVHSHRLSLFLSSGVNQRNGLEVLSTKFGDLKEDSWEFLTDFIHKTFPPKGSDDVKFNMMVLLPVALVFLAQIHCNLSPAEANFYISCGADNEFDRRLDAKITFNHLELEDIESLTQHNEQTATTKDTEKIKKAINTLTQQNQQTATTKVTEKTKKAINILTQKNQQTGTTATKANEKTKKAINTLTQQNQQTATTPTKAAEKQRKHRAK